MPDMWPWGSLSEARRPACGNQATVLEDLPGKDSGGRVSVRRTSLATGGTFQTGNNGNAFAGFLVVNDVLARL